MADEFKKDPKLFDYTPRDLSIRAPEQSNMDATEKGMLGFKALLTALDIAQTRNIARNPDKYQEDASSWAIGHHPSPDKATAFLLGNLAANAAASALIPSGWAKKGLLGLSIGEQANSVLGNHKAGIKPRW